MFEIEQGVFDVVHIVQGGFFSLSGTGALTMDAALASLYVQRIVNESILFIISFHIVFNPVYFFHCLFNVVFMSSNFLLR